VGITGLFGLRGLLTSKPVVNLVDHSAGVQGELPESKASQALILRARDNKEARQNKTN